MIRWAELSIALHTAAAQWVGAVRAQGVFASAPFVAAALSLAIFGDHLTAPQATATVLFLISVVVLAATEHEHQHPHIRMTTAVTCMSTPSL